jgi:hypothetical protein
LHARPSSGGDRFDLDLHNSGLDLTEQILALGERKSEFLGTNTSRFATYLCNVDRLQDLTGQSSFDAYDEFHGGPSRRHVSRACAPNITSITPNIVPVPTVADRVATDGRAARVSRFSIRLRPDDQILLRERATARGIPAATYVSVLTRAHLRSLSPLPKEELLSLRRTVSELGRIGRNLNQIARAANQGERTSGPSREDLRAIVRVCEGLRDHVKGLLSANIKAWEQGYAEPGL